MDKNSEIFVAGHRGLVGSAIARLLRNEGYTNLIVRTHSEVDLCNQNAVENFFAKEKPEFVFLAAAKVCGIVANSTYPAQFIYENLQIQNNVIHQSYVAGVKKLCFLGSSCIYPKFAPQPMKEEYLLSGKLEPTNEPYAIAKIAGIKMCEAYNRQYGTNFISVMPTNLYGPNDNFDLQNSHVIPALIRKFVEAKQTNAATVTVWGTGTPRREFLFVDDMASACIFLMKNFNGNEFVNIGTGVDVSIAELSEMIAGIVGFTGEILFDRTKPDGTPRKLSDISKLRQAGWTPTVSLNDGLVETIRWFTAEVANR